MSFYDRIGPFALGSRLRQLGDRLAEDAAQIYALYGTDLQPRWFPVFYVLSERPEESVSAIGQEIGQSHASVSQIVAEMAKQGYVTVGKRGSDRRKAFVSLSAKGRAAREKVQPQYADVNAAVEVLLREVPGDLWSTVASFEQALARRSLFARVCGARKEREGRRVAIVPYAAKYASAFRRLNERWIRQHFKIEEADRRMLSNPKKWILDPGGHILVAVLDGRPVGVCALVPHGEGCFELAKMTVANSERGKNIGLTLGRAAIATAREAGAARLYLESNSKLGPALNLYRKLGFEMVPGRPSPYARADVRMELQIKLPAPAGLTRQPAARPDLGRLD